PRVPNAGPATLPGGLAVPTPPGLVRRGSELVPRSAPPRGHDLRVIRVEGVVGPSRTPPPEGPGTGADLADVVDTLFVRARERAFVVGVTADASRAATKSGVAVELAHRLAGGGAARVLLVDAHFDYPVVASLVGIEVPSGGGFSQQLRARAVVREQTGPGRCAG
ncbi:MAG: hypothetical protein FJ104_04415, partial [Deltaproteobacteria bacterium]|nr:hypothetical protein [Deltaproteobacteria bacterium]